MKALRVPAGRVVANCRSVLCRTTSMGVSPSSCCATKCSASRRRKKLPDRGSLTTKDLPSGVCCSRTVKSVRSLGAEEVMTPREAQGSVREGRRKHFGSPPLHRCVNRQRFRSTWSPGGSRGQHESHSQLSWVPQVLVQLPPTLTPTPSPRLPPRKMPGAIRCSSFSSSRFRCFILGSPPFSLGWPPPVSLGRKDWSGPAAEGTSDSIPVRGSPGGKRPGTPGGLPEQFRGGAYSIAWKQDRCQRWAPPPRSAAVMLDRLRPPSSQTRGRP